MGRSGDMDGGDAAVRRGVVPAGKGPVMVVALYVDGVQDLVVDVDDPDVWVAASVLVESAIAGRDVTVVAVPAPTLAVHVNSPQYADVAQVVVT